MIETHDNTDTIKGLGLVSGGLDSLIACLLMKHQNIDIIALNFTSTICMCTKMYQNTECGLNLVYDKLGIKIISLPKEDDYLETNSNPKYGHGKNLNPCIDCRIYILKKAKKFIEDNNIDFIFTGELLNQRPKSQHFEVLKIVEKESKLEGRLLRPLSALLLEPTLLEKKGIIDRSKLLRIRGRSRKIQLELARKHKMIENYYACGECLLTNEKCSNRLKDYLKFNNDLKMTDITFLKYGRHFRFNNTKIIVGRNQVENNILSQMKNSNDLMMEAFDAVGPITLLQGEQDNEALTYGAQLTLRYSDFDGEYGKVRYRSDNILTVTTS